MVGTGVSDTIDFLVHIFTTAHRPDSNDDWPLETHRTSSL